MSFLGKGNYAGCGYCGERIGGSFRKSSIDCMESPPFVSLLDTLAKPPRHRLCAATPGAKMRRRRVQHSINNPVICQDCQKGLNAFARACWEIEKEKAS